MKYRFYKFALFSELRTFIHIVNAESFAARSLSPCSCLSRKSDHIHHEFLWQWLLGIRPDRLLLTEGELVQLIQHEPLGLWVQLTLMLLAVLGASGLEDTKEEPRCETAVVDARVLVELDSSEPLRGECPLERS